MAMSADEKTDVITPAPEFTAPPALEFEALRELVGRYGRSPLGRVALEKIAPSNNRAAIEAALADAGEGIAYLRAASQPQAAARGAAIRLNLGVPGDPTPAIARLRIEGAMLEGREIADVSRLLDVAAEARSIL